MKHCKKQVFYINIVVVTHASLKVGKTQDAVCLVVEENIVLRNLLCLGIHRLIVLLLTVEDVLYGFKQFLSNGFLIHIQMLHSLIREVIAILNHSKEDMLRTHALAMQLCCIVSGLLQKVYELICILMFH